MDLAQIQTMKKEGIKISCLTVYDASMARILAREGIDIILVGDSLGMVIQGRNDTLAVTMNDMCYHTKIVAPFCKNSYLITDMPYKSYTKDVALTNAKKLIESGAQMVKLEGNEIEIVKILVKEKIAVCGHLGLQPQSVHKLGGYKIQGKVKEDADKIIKDAISLEKAGIKLLVLECIPPKLAKKISKKLTIPTIGIGAGVDCDGQVLVIYDMLGMNEKKLKFNRDFLQNNNSVKKAINCYIKAVKNKTFPTIDESF